MKKPVNKVCCIKCSLTKKTKDFGIQTDTSRPEKAFIPLSIKPAADGEPCIFDSSGRFCLHFLREPGVYERVIKDSHLYSPSLIETYLSDNPHMIPMLSNLLERNVFWYTCQFDETFSNGIMTTKRKVFVFYWS